MANLIITYSIQVTVWVRIWLSSVTNHPRAIKSSITRTNLWSNVAWNVCLYSRYTLLDASNMAVIKNNNNSPRSTIKYMAGHDRPLVLRCVKSVVMYTGQNSDCSVSRGACGRTKIAPREKTTVTLGMGLLNAFLPLRWFAPFLRMI